MVSDHSLIFVTAMLMIMGHAIRRAFGCGVLWGLVLPTNSYLWALQTFSLWYTKSRACNEPENDVFAQPHRFA
jgi:hypothetical protein